MSDVLTVKDLNFRYLKTQRFLFQNFNFVLKRGQKIGLVGGNGAGKSTLIKLILGIYQAENGDVLTHGVNNNWNSSLEEVAYVGDPGYNPILLGLPIGHKVETIWKVLKVLYHSKSDSEYEEIIEKMDMRSLFNKDVSFLSTGERKRVMLAMAFFRFPSVFIFDEPLDGLDKNILPFVSQKLQEIKTREDCSIIYISHNRIEVDLYSDQVYELKDGSITPVDQLTYKCHIKTQTEEQIKNLNYGEILNLLEKKLSEKEQEILVNMQAIKGRTL